MVEQDAIFLAKARESLAGAESEFVNGRYNNCANRCYDSCFQAAVHALDEHAIPPRADAWSHEGVQATFVGELINRRKTYPGELRETLLRTQSLRNTAADEAHWVTETQASRALRRTRGFVAAVDGGGRR